MEKQGIAKQIQVAKGIIDWKKIPWGPIAAGLTVSIIGSTIDTFADEIIDWLKGQNLKSKSKEYYVEMLKAHPSLKKEDPKVVARYWASLFHFAPYMAADPMSSGAFIRQQFSGGYPELYGGPLIDTVNNLTGINKSLTDSRSKGRGFREAVNPAASQMLGLTYRNFAGFKEDEPKPEKEKKKS